MELHGVGEPFLHSNLFEFSTEATKRGFGLAICTNAILLNKRMARVLYKSGIKKVVVSLETKENYEKIRCANIYDHVLENVNEFAESYPEIDMEIYMIYIGKKSPALTLPQARMLLTAVLPVIPFDKKYAIEVLGYRQKRNYISCRSHRKAKIKRIRKIAAKAAQKNATVVISVTPKKEIFRR